ncbi:MAG: hypothetical protein N2316_06575 [Spirochaetes bacterium]|nr:hypothetical protein [Spirochaetota bacterium]
MIRLKNGEEVHYREDFDAYFHAIIIGIIKASLRSASFNMERGEDGKAFNTRLLREIMDNCIYIAKQIQDMGTKDPSMQSLLITASFFNCAMASLAKLGTFGNEGTSGENSQEALH